MGRSAGGTDGSTLFDEVTRTDCRGSRHSEALFTFLNRVDSTFFGRVRETLQEWFAHLPESGRPDVRGRIRSGDDHEFMGAFWEIYLHEYLTRSGFSAELHPKIPGTGRTPDFRCRKDSTVIFVEATIIAPPDSEKAANRREAAALDALNRTQVTDFMSGSESWNEGLSRFPWRGSDRSWSAGSHRWTRTTSQSCTSTIPLFPCQSMSSRPTGGSSSSAPFPRSRRNEANSQSGQLEPGVPRRPP